MSYILEALKKAQAERQLGSAPTIHALPIQAAAAERSGAGRLPLAIAVTAAVVAAIGAGVLWWRQATPVAPPVLASAVVEPAPAPVQQLPPAPVQQLPPAPAAMARPLPVVRPVAAAPAPTPPPVATKSGAAALPAPARVSAPAAQASEPAAAPEENLPMLRELPEAQRSGMPQVSFGGYMYSPNPADRLLLIDKTLRREGEEVAPGLVLEKLLPKAAVMNYRGTRYRVPY